MLDLLLTSILDLATRFLITWTVFCVNASTLEHIKDCLYASKTAESELNFVEWLNREWWPLTWWFPCRVHYNDSQPTQLKSKKYPKLAKQ